MGYALNELISAVKKSVWHPVKIDACMGTKIKVTIDFILMVHQETLNWRFTKNTIPSITTQSF